MPDLLTRTASGASVSRQEEGGAFSALRTTAIKFPKLSRLAAVALGGVALSATAPKVESSVHLAPEEVHEQIGIEYARNYGAGTARVIRKDGLSQRAGCVIFSNPQGGDDGVIFSDHQYMNAFANGHTLEKILIYPGHVDFWNDESPCLEVDLQTLEQCKIPAGQGIDTLIDLRAGRVKGNFATLTANTSHAFKPPYLYRSKEAAQAASSAAEAEGRKTATLAEANDGTIITNAGPGRIFRPLDNPPPNPADVVTQTGFVSGYHIPLDMSSTDTSNALARFGLNSSYYTGMYFYHRRNINGAGGIGADRDSGSGGWFTAQTETGNQVCLGYMTKAVEGGWVDKKYFGSGTLVTIRVGQEDIAEFIYDKIVPEVVVPQMPAQVQLAITRTANGSFLIGAIASTAGNSPSVHVQVQSSPSLDEGATWVDEGTLVTANDSSTSIVVPFKDYRPHLFFRGIILSEGEQRGVAKRAKIVVDEQTLLDRESWDE